jgi:hypothetical protein
VFYPLEIEGVRPHRPMIVVESVKARELAILARREQIHVRMQPKLSHGLAKKPRVELPIHMVADSARKLVRPCVQSAREPSKTHLQPVLLLPVEEGRAFF